MKTQSVLKINQLTKKYEGSKTASVSGFSLEVVNGEIVALLGESGCGKTTLLRLIAGFEVPTAGEIWLHDRLVGSEHVFVEPEQRGVGIVFQDYALFPHMTVLENIMFGLFRLPKALQRERAAAIMELTGLSGLEVRYPHQVSGGQKQRVALARALAPGPGIMLFDEPFSNIDTPLRKQIREDIHQILKKTGVTAIFVTHDVRDLMKLADRLVVMKEGMILKTGSPDEIATSSENNYTRSFFD